MDRRLALRGRSPQAPESDVAMGRGSLDRRSDSMAQDRWPPEARPWQKIPSERSVRRSRPAAL